MPAIVVEERHSIARIVLDNPARRNAVTLNMWRQLEDTCIQLGDRGDLTLVTFEGAGTETFCAGGDIQEFARLRDTPERAKEYDDQLDRALRRIARLPQVTLAIVRGFCLGAGLFIAAHCDLRVCRSDARFGIPVGRLGMTASYAQIGRLAQLTGYGFTQELLFTGHLVDARRAVEARLCAFAESETEFGPRVDTLMRGVQSMSPLANRVHKRMIQALMRSGHVDHLAPADWRWSRVMESSEDYTEGVRAFLAKEKPAFKGR